MRCSRKSAFPTIPSATSRTVDVAAYRDRLVKAHVDAALYQTSAGRVREGLRSYRAGLRIEGSRLRKFKGSLRLVLALPKALAS